MTTKAYITEIVDKKTVKIRMPLFNKIEGVSGSTPNSELYSATLCYQGGVIPSYEIGDVVFVQFEDNYLDRPIVMGKLKNTTSTKEDDGLPDIYCNTLNVTGAVTMGEETKIGDIEYAAIKCLDGTENNIKQSFSDVDTEFSELHKIIGDVAPEAPSLVESLTDLKTTVSTGMSSLSASIEQINNSIGDISEEGSSLEERISSLESTALTNPIILDKHIGYGDVFPADPSDGQLFFKLV